MMIVPLNAHRDRGTSGAAQATFARTFPLALAVLSACGVTRAPAPAVPNEAPARDIIVRTSRFAIHANAYVDFYATGRASTREATSSDAGASFLLEPPLVVKLGACSDDPCARNALVGTPLGALDDFLHGTWAEHESEARRVVGRNGTPLMELEDVLAPALGRQIGVVWPNDPIVVYVAHEEGRLDEVGGRDGAVLDIEGDCFEGNALLECLFTRALEVLLPDSELGRAFEEARAGQSEADRTESAGVTPCVAALAADVAVASAERRYTPTRRFVTVCSEPARAWLGREWPKRVRRDESPKEFAANLVGEWVRGRW
jgi:hypothetical protein